MAIPFEDIERNVLLFLEHFWHIAGIEYAQSATKSIVGNDAPTTYTRRVMGLKKRSLSRSGAANHVITATKDRSSWYPSKSAVRKGLGFFGHVTWQASGSSTKQSEHTPERDKKHP
ncbi:hypothetical protein [Variovorax sp. PCZ-1]|uniref:hypothetical protein n=1 Tax=Variovorax sp. PCZ-1 TaxID=2835533 RepID=UPI001BD0059B|nr:hypothetical protein [Variovorax sp. PCZ-1]MBS7807577.1 hypothetical protein [Variovorax sp. PCZ-1]